MVLRLISLCCVLLVAVAAYGGVREGTVSLVMIDAVAPTLVFVKVNGVFTQPEPGCASSSAYDFVLDLSTTTGKAWYPMLLAAQASETTVTLGGTENCLLRAGYEDLRYVETRR